MILANELRIGNWIEFPKNGYKGNTICDVFDISTDKINYCADPNMCNGIPLTPEILLKCGGQKADIRDPFGGICFKIAEGYSIRIRNIEGQYGWDYNGLQIPINSVHQLQNFYFALTQTELTVNFTLH